MSFCTNPIPKLCTFCPLTLGRTSVRMVLSKERRFASCI
nr:MAG TPA: hypothetical protein [Caudoviricetes sp.]